MKVLFEHSKCLIIELLRQPTYVVSTITFPALFYVIFALPESKDVYSSNLLLASFSCFAVFGVVFLQFGVSLAQDKNRPWQIYLRTLPLRNIYLLLARFISVGFFSLFAVAVLVVLALAYTEADLTSKNWFLFVGTLILGGMSFSTMGLCLGYFSSEKSSLPLGNLVYLTLTFAGGLWKPPKLLPSMLKDISEWLPTRHYGELLWSVVDNQGVATERIVYLFAYALLFAAVAYYGFQKHKVARSM